MVAECTHVAGPHVQWLVVLVNIGIGQVVLLFVARALLLLLLYLQLLELLLALLLQVLLKLVVLSVCGWWLLELLLLQLGRQAGRAGSTAVLMQEVLIRLQVAWRRHRVQI